MSDEAAIEETSTDSTTEAAPSDVETGIADEGSESVEAASEESPEGSESTETETPEQIAAKPAIPEVDETISPELYYDAVQAGLDKTDFAQIKTASELKRAIAIASRLKPQKDSGQQPQQAEELQIDALIPDLPKDEEYSDGFKKVWGGVREGFKKALTQERERSNQALGQLYDVIQNLQHERNVERFDQGLSTLPDAETLFGKGAVDPQTQKELHANRVKLWDAKNTITQGYQARNAQMPPQHELMQQAYQLAFGKHIEKAKAKELVAKMKKNSSQHTIAPTNRKGVEAGNPDEKAHMAVSKKLRDLGLKR